MVKVEGTTITITRGDTLTVKVNIFDANGEAYTPQEGEVVRFALKRKISDAEPIFNKVIDNQTLILRLESSETKALENPIVKGEVVPYVYDIQITLLDGTVYTFIHEATLNVAPEVE